MKESFKSLTQSKAMYPVLLLAVFLLLLILSSGLYDLLAPSGASSWAKPALATASPTAASTPGWWSAMPTAVPLSSSPTPSATPEK